MDELTVGEAAARTGWSPRMLRYLERAGLVAPRRTAAGYRLYGLLELNQLRSLRELRRRFGVVDLTDGDRIAGFREAPRLPHWVNAGIYVLDDEALARLPERGDHEQSTFPELAAEGKLYGFRHEGLWITVNTPKDLERAERYYSEHPELRPTLARNRS